MDRQTLHATCVAFDGRAVLLIGPSGAGKSDCALRLIDLGATLVADDQTCLVCEGEAVIAKPPEALAGLLEARHVGILRLPYCTQAKVDLIVELVGPNEPLDRLPERQDYSLLDRPVKWLKLRGLEASTPAKIKWALLGKLEDAG